jgi:hypothetical protein
MGTVPGQQYCGASKARLAGAYNRRFKFQKRRQLFRTHHETLSIATMRVNNPDRSSGLKATRLQSTIRLLLIVNYGVVELFPFDGVPAHG